MATETKTFYPGAYDASLSSLTGSGISNANNPVGKGPDNLVFANIHANNSVRPVYASWPFDVASIPRNAVIDSVVCNATASMSSVSSVSLASMQLYSGTVAKGNSVSFKSAVQSTYSINGQGWTREELASVCLRLTVDTSASQVRNARFYGADLTVTYTYQSEKFMLKLGGKYNDIARVFKKVSGIWVEQTELANVVDQTKRLVNGGEYVVELPEGYTRLEYIESTGSQYIDTGFKPNQDTRLDMDAMVRSIANTADGTGFTPYGSGIKNGSDSFELYTAGSQYCVNYDGQTNKIGNPAVGERIFVSHDKNVVTVSTLGGSPISYTFAYQAFNAPSTLPLFAVYRPSGILRGLCRIYFCQIYDNGTMVRDYIPCLNSSGVPGLYDKVNGVFYSSANGTDFEYPNFVSLISFTIKGVSYQAEPGMTWAQWCASSYNTGGFSVVADLGGDIIDNGSIVVTHSGGKPVLPGAVIEENYAYS